MTADQLTPKKAVMKKHQMAFLTSFAQHGVVMTAAKDAGVSRQVVYAWLEKDEEFALLFNQAKEDARDALRQEIYRRAVSGWDEDIYQLGKYAGKVHKYSDTLLIFHAKALMPEYRDSKNIELTGKDGSALEVHLFVPDQAPPPLSVDRVEGAGEAASSPLASTPRGEERI